MNTESVPEALGYSAEERFHHTLGLHARDPFLVVGSFDIPKIRLKV